MVLWLPSPRPCSDRNSAHDRGGHRDGDTLPDGRRRVRLDDVAQGRVQRREHSRTDAPHAGRVGPDRVLSVTMPAHRSQPGVPNAFPALCSSLRPECVVGSLSRALCCSTFHTAHTPLPPLAACTGGLRWSPSWRPWSPRVTHSRWRSSFAPGPRVCGWPRCQSSLWTVCSARASWARGRSLSISPECCASCSRFRSNCHPFNS